MPDYNTPGVPEPEDSAKAQRAKTGAGPDDTNVSPPRCYDQCIEADPLPNNKLPRQTAAGQGDVYQN